MRRLLLPLLLAPALLHAATRPAPAAAPRPHPAMPAPAFAGLLGTAMLALVMGRRRFTRTAALDLKA